MGTALVVTVIVQTWNESYLVGAWLDHHYRLFDHGILIDGGSTDGTREIWRERAPDWEIVDAWGDSFDTRENDAQVTEIERRVEGWKISLGITEFLLHPDLRRYVIDQTGRVVRTRGVVMVDPSEVWDVPVDPTFPLVSQCRWGYFEDERSTNDPFRNRTIEHSRLLHNYRDGEYGLGRHGSGHPADVDPDLILAWFAFAPMTPEFRKRKLQIHGRISERDMEQYGMASTHKAVPDEARLREVWEWECGRAEDLWSHPDYLAAFRRWLQGRSTWSG